MTTQEQIAALEDVLSSGILEVTDGNRTIVYRSVEELEKILAILRFDAAEKQD